jgi:hypothetical protein
MIVKTLLGFLAVIAAVVVVASFQPEDFAVERATVVNAPAEAVFAKVNDFRQWDGWSPWAKLDPAMKTTFEGPAAGTGAKYSWAGNGKVGEGAMTIVDSQPNALVRIQLDFLKPFQATNMTDFSFRAEGAGTAVNWRMTGKKNLVSKVMGLFMSMDKMVGGDFEKGLAALKALSESGAR